MAQILFQIAVFGITHRLTAKIRKHNIIHSFFFHLCLCLCWSVGRRTRPRGKGEDSLARCKSPGQRSSLADAWETYYKKDTGAVGSWTTGYLLPAASCPHHLSNSSVFSLTFKLTHRIHFAVDFSCTPAGTMIFRKLFTWAVSSQTQ